MTFRTILLTISISAFLSCGSNPASETTLVKADSILDDLNIAEEDPSDTQPNTIDKYANILSIIQKGDTTILDADYIQYLTGEAAIEEATKAGEVDTFRTKDGRIELVVPNDYYIVNKSKKIRQLSLTRDCAFDLLYNPDRAHPISGNSLKSLKTIYRDSPFILTIDKSGFVVKIKEVFIP
ncbi:hypothetical protein [Lacibacter sediminis]|uniref:Uncharacterized protein n=1 Tax=Lacibacter sediminis TaxID=2760713 RepID=A0A7G5XLS5_9BACT|nr:hypothetical protein [Lacibacter sediminis]QNA46428.1 hypothetical protein H4075_09725 [Lacibacter sediminis]